MAASGSFALNIQELRRRAREHMEAGAVTSNYEGDVNTTVKILNEALATELVCVLRYKYHAIAAVGIDSESVKKEFAEHARDELQRGRWVELLTGLGLFGNFALCLLDHAQNGFWAPIEWLSVAAGALGGLAFVTSAAAREERVNERLFLWIVLALMAGTGVLGAALHLRAVLASTAASLLQRVQYGAPVFAPLLYVDLAVLGAMGLLARASPSRGASVVAGFGRGQDLPGRTGA